MFNILLKIGFPFSRTLKLVRQGVSITNSKNPVSIAGGQQSMTVIDCCPPLPLKFTLHCASAATLIVGSVAVPNPTTVGAAVHIITEIIEKC